MTAATCRGLLALWLALSMLSLPIAAEGPKTVKAAGSASGTLGSMQCSAGETECAGERADATESQLFDGTELASLQSRAEQPGEEVAGGALTNQQLTYIVIALAAAVIVLILV